MEGRRRRTQEGWLIRVGADRLALREEIEDVLATIGPDDNLKFTYVAPGTDAGFAQVGCSVTFALAVIAALSGMVIVFILAGYVNPGAGAIGFFVGWLGGMFASSQVVKIAVRVRRLRPDAENVAYLIGFCAAVILAAIVTVLLALVSAPGRTVG